MLAEFLVAAMISAVAKDMHVVLVMTRVQLHSVNIQYLLLMQVLSLCVIAAYTGTYKHDGAILSLQLPVGVHTAMFFCVSCTWPKNSDYCTIAYLVMYVDPCRSLCLTEALQGVHPQSATLL
eukprot:GHRR01031750.1.p1 GENE.GHRR01031750.1~~GHRR01031750.1.p1  ORF type:complete len:122 (+),score=19.06 GHRR01031750.1:176-541(+)